MSRQDRIQQAVLKSRKDFLHYSVKQEKELYDLLDNAAKEIRNRIADYAEKGKIPPDRLTALLGTKKNTDPDSIRGILKQLRPKVSGHLKKGMRQSINFGIKSQIESFKDINLPKNARLHIGSSFIGKDGQIRPYDVKTTKWKQSVWGRINSDAMDHLMKTQYGGITLSDRVWDISWEAEKSIRNRVQSGVLLGDSPQKVARDCKKYLVEPNARFRRVRKDGRLTLSKPAKRYKPGRGVYRSAYQNAVRLARTEYARAYHEGTVRYVQRKKWLKGFISRVGSSNPAPYDEFVNGKFFPKDSPPNIPYHPNCCHPDSIVQAGGDITGTSRRWYKGEMITIHTASGKQLTCTPNHPIFSDGGFVSANSIDIGSNLVCIDSRNVPIFNGYDIQRPALIEDICSSWEKYFAGFSIPVEISPKDFHGDGVGSDIAIITSNCFLRSTFNSSFFKHFKKLFFSIRDYARSIRLRFNRPGMLAFGFPRNLLTRPSNVSRLCHFNPLFGSICTRAKKVSCFLASNLGSRFNQSSPDSTAINIKPQSKFLFRKSGLVKGDDFVSRQIKSIPTTPFGFNDTVIHIETFQYNGYVCNLETTQSYYFAGGIATHNCMCYAEPVFKDVPDDQLDVAPSKAEYDKKIKKT